MTPKLKQEVESAYDSCLDHNASLRKDFETLSNEYQQLNAKVARLETRVQRLRDALKFECGDRCAKGINDCNASEALKQDDADREGV